MTTLQRLQAIAQRGVPVGEFQFMENLAMETLQLIALPCQLGPLARHLDLHFSHLRHQRLLVLLELKALLLEFLAQSADKDRPPEAFNRIPGLAMRIQPLLERLSRIALLG